MIEPLQAFDLEAACLRRRPNPRLRPKGRNSPRRCLGAVLCCMGIAFASPPANGAPAPAPATKSPQVPSWPNAVLALRDQVRESASIRGADREALAPLWEQHQDLYPIQWDWVLQDAGMPWDQWLQGGVRPSVLAQMVRHVTDELGTPAAPLQKEAQRLRTDRRDPMLLQWLELYERAAQMRRARRLHGLDRRAPRIVFTRKQTLRPSFFAYTEGQSDAQNERHFIPGSALCLLELTGTRARIETLLADEGGMIRDPAVSWDGTRILFAWKKSLDDDDYHLYEMELPGRRIRALTSGLGFADYEGAYLPNGDLVFTSTRCVQTVDCWWTEVSNLHTCDANGRYLRRLGFDQVHTVYPSVLDDGRVIYTRWDYNDRGQVFPQGLFQMNPDGTGQSEFYGNNSWFPTTIAHMRGIPGTGKVMGIFCGHHTAQAGKLAVLDPSRGRQENAGAQLIAPMRPTQPERIDAYGQEGDLFQYPWPLTSAECLVGYAPLGWSWRDGRFGIYWMDQDGRRELLAWDPAISCSQPVPLVPRTPPPVRPSLTDHGETQGTYYVQDVSAGPGLAGIPRGSVKRLRVVALEYRAAGIGHNSSAGPAGEALICTPVATGNGSWDVKVVLGTTPVCDDGSAAFHVPARVPVYFQALDDQGRALQTMRSWSTLQPGERQACVGCHESKNSAPPVTSPPPLAFRRGPLSLEPMHQPPRGFSFAKEIQPILDRHCIRCHHDRSLPPPDPRGSPPPPAALTSTQAFSLLGETVLDPIASRTWSDAYLALTGARRQDPPLEEGVYVGDPGGRLVSWISSQSEPSPLPPRFAGSIRSGLLDLFHQEHQNIRLTPQELETIACWIDLLVPYCGDYREANAWTTDDQNKYDRFQHKRDRVQALEKQNLEALARTPQTSKP